MRAKPGEKSAASEGFTVSAGSDGRSEAGAWPSRPRVRFTSASAPAGRRATSDSIDSGRKTKASGIIIVVAIAPSRNTDRQSPVAARNRAAKIGRASGRERGGQDV